jgi:hypothetical protein
MRSIYDIVDDIKACMEQVDEETGELLNVEKLDSLLMEKEKKLEGVALWWIELGEDIETIKSQKQRLADKQKAVEKQREQIKEYLSKALDGEKLSTALVKISYRKSESVEVTDLTELDEIYLKYAAPTVDKAAVKKALKAGTVLNGVRLVESNNIQIK